MKKRKKYATGTAVKQYMEDPSTALQQNQINNAQAQYEAESNPWTQGMGILGNLMMQYGLSQGGLGTSGAAQAGNAAIPILGNMKFPNGGTVPVEVEGGEVAETPDNMLLDFKGPDHSNGGIDIDLPPGTDIFSKRIKVDGKTMAERKKKREGKINTLERLLGKNPTDALTKNSMKRTQKTNQIQEDKDMQIQEMISAIEGMADMFAMGGVVGDPPTKRAKLLQRLQSLGIATDQTPETFQQLQEADVQNYLNIMFEQNPNIKRPEEAKQKINELLSKGGQPQTISKTKFQVAENPKQEVVKPGLTRDEIFAKTRKELQDQGLDPNTGTFEFNGKTFSTQLSPTGGSSDEREMTTVEAKESNEILDAEDYFKNKAKMAYGGRTKYPNGGPVDFTLYENSQYADPMDANAFTGDFTGDMIADSSDDLVQQQPYDLSQSLQNLLQNFNDPSTFGDKVGLAGNLVSTFAPYLNTLKNRGGDTPNINPYINFGEKGLQTLDQTKGMSESLRDNSLKDLQLSRTAALKRGRNSARGVNTMRALDLASTLQADTQATDIQDNYTRQLMNIFSQQAGMENQQDQVVMQGEAARDLADRQDRDNFSTQLGKDKANIGYGLQETGKDLNSIKQNQVINNLLAELSKYGITVDSQGKVTTKK